MTFKVKTTLTVLPLGRVQTLHRISYDSVRDRKECDSLENAGATSSQHRKDSDLSFMFI